MLVARPYSGGAGVLAASDLGDPSRPALRQAQELARRRAVPFTILHCVPPPAPAAFALTHVGQPSAALLTELTRPTLDAARSRIVELLDNDSRKPTVRVEVGEPDTTILSSADAENVGQIVMGTRGRTGLSRLLVGRVARRVVGHALCSVLVVRLE